MLIPISLLLFTFLCSVCCFQTQRCFFRRKGLTLSSTISSVDGFELLNDFLKSNRLKVLTRTDSSEVIHLEFFDSRWPTFLLKLVFLLPKVVRKYIFKPAAKTGVRTYSASSLEMDDLVHNLYLSDKFYEETVERLKGAANNNISASSNTASDDNNLKNDNKSVRGIVSSTTRQEPDHVKGVVKVGLFVYMWVSPERRGGGIGEYLLDLCKDYCRRKGDHYMILVHDDNGSNKLLQYYEQRGFTRIEYFLQKGMICRL